MTNEEFNALPERTRRIMIAEDILAHADYRARTGCGYLWIPNKSPDLIGDMQSQLPQIESECNCCAIGALAIATARIADGLRFETVVADAANRYYYASEMKLFNFMGQHFPQWMLHDIERAFEGWVSGWFDITGFNQSMSVLRRIARNIIRNNGNFIIGDLAE